MKAIQIPLAFMLSCMPRVQPDPINEASYRNADDSWSDTGDFETAQEAVYISTIADDYSIGALVRVDMSNLRVDEDLTATTGDTVVVTTGGKVVILNRLNTDTVRIYEPGEWTHPTVEFALPDLSNPQDAAICNDQIWVSQHNRDRLTAHSLTTGMVVDSVDLTLWGGADGFAEATSLHVQGDVMQIIVEQFNQNDNWSSEGGAILSVPCQGGTPTQLVEIGPSPSLVTSNDAETWGVRTGLYGEIDGAIYRLDSNGIQTPPIITEEEVQADITSAAMTQNHLVFITADSDWNYSLRCLDLQNGDVATGMTTSSFLSDLAIDYRGRAWVAARPGWSSDTPEPGGLHVFDPEGCATALTSEGPIRTTLNPYNISFL